MKNKIIAFMLLSVFGVEGCVFDSTNEPTLVADYTNVPLPTTVQIKKTEDVEKGAEYEILTLPAALALTLERSPDLRSFSRELRVGEARILQAGLRPNPEISLAVEDVFGSGKYGGGDQAQSTLQLSQIIELGDKRAARIEVAQTASDSFKDEYEIKRIEVLTSLTDKFIRTVADQNLLRLAEKAESLAHQAYENIKKRSRAGGVSELEETKARVMQARSRIAAEHAEHELLTSKRELSAFWGADKPTFTEAKSDLFQSNELPSLEDLLSRTDESIEVKKWATEKRLREAEQKLAEAKSVPNLLLGAGPRRLEASHNESWVFQFAMPIPIFDRNQGARQEAAILKDKVAIDEQASFLRLKTDLFGLYQEAKHAQTEMETMKTEIIPQAERSLKIAQHGYNQGRFSYLDLLDAQRTLLEVYRENIEAAYSFHSFINSIERLLGTSLNRALNNQR